MSKLLQKLTRIASRRKPGPFEKKTGYRFKKSELIEKAFRHRSYIHEAENHPKESNERLEFLGDAVLNMVVTDFLYRRYPDKNEGDLSQIKSLVVSKKILGKAAETLGLGGFLYLSDSEDRSGGRQRPSIIADAFEAVIGAIFLDGGVKAASEFIQHTVLEDVDDLLADENHQNFKSLLLEHVQGMGIGAPLYLVESETGPDHSKTFEVGVWVKKELWGKGAGKSKKAAEQDAARNAISQKGI